MRSVVEAVLVYGNFSCCVICLGLEVFCAIHRNRCACGVAVLEVPDVVSKRLAMERFEMLKRGKHWVSIILTLGILSFEFMMLSTNFATSFTLMVLVILPTLICTSWFALTEISAGFTRTRLLVWLCVLGMLMLPLHTEHFLLGFIAHVIFNILVSFALDPTHVAIIAIILSLVFCACHLYGGASWIWTLFGAFAIGILPVSLSMIVSHVVRKSLASALRNAITEEAGQALLALLTARYDAVLELDEATQIVHASETFFGMASALPPKGMRDTSQQLLRLSPSMSSHRPSPACKPLLRQSFAEMLTNNVDREQLTACIQEQKSLLEAGRQTVCDGALEAGTASFTRHATGLQVNMQTQDKKELKLSLYCAACHDAEACRPRFFFGVCVSQAADDAPQGPDAHLAVDPRPTSSTLSREWLKFDAKSRKLALTEHAILKGSHYPAGTRLSAAFPPKIWPSFEPFLANMLVDARLGEPRLYKTVKYKSRSGHKVKEHVHVELLRDSRKERGGPMEMLVTFVAQPHEKRGSGSLASSSGAHFTATLSDISEHDPDLDAISRLVEMEGGLVANLPGEDTAMAAEVELRSEVKEEVHVELLRDSRTGRGGPMEMPATSVAQPHEQRGSGSLPSLSGAHFTATFPDSNEHDPVLDEVADFVEMLRELVANVPGEDTAMTAEVEHEEDGPMQMSATFANNETMSPHTKFPETAALTASNLDQHLSL